MVNTSSRPGRRGAAYVEARGPWRCGPAALPASAKPESPALINMLVLLADFQLNPAQPFFWQKYSGSMVETRGSHQLTSQLRRIAFSRGRAVARNV